MADNYIGEIRYFPYFRGAPQGWLVCDGSTQSISSYEALASLLGTTYGGNGTTSFGLPDLRGRLPIGAGPGNVLGAQTGTETVALNSQQLPQHNHMLQASTQAGNSTSPGGTVYAAGPSAGVQFYEVPTTATFVQMSTSMIGSTGQGLPHNNCAPTLPIVACIAWDGVYPTKAS